DRDRGRSGRILRTIRQGPVGRQGAGRGDAQPEHSGGAESAIGDRWQGAGGEDCWQLAQWGDWHGRPGGLKTGRYTDRLGCRFNSLPCQGEGWGGVALRQGLRARLMVRLTPLNLPLPEGRQLASLSLPNGKETLRARAHDPGDDNTPRTHGFSRP